MDLIKKLIKPLRLLSIHTRGPSHQLSLINIMAQSLIALARDNDAIQVLYNEYDDLIMSTFLEGIDGYENVYDDITDLIVRRNMCEAVASRRTELLASITTLQALAVIPGSNLYVVDCGSDHRCPNGLRDPATASHILVHVHGGIANTRAFVEPGNKLEDGDLATLAETFFGNGECWFNSVFDAVRQRNPEATLVTNRVGATRVTNRGCMWLL
jgi:hypothetical protein